MVERDVQGSLFPDELQQDSVLEEERCCDVQAGLDVIHTVHLQSVTVFWKELGLADKKSYQFNNVDELAVFWDAEISPWLVANCRGHVNPHEAGVWFANRDDAVLFKLTWAGAFPG